MLIDGIEYLTRSNFKLYCAKCYKNPDNPDFESLESDLFNVAHIKRLISNYSQKGEIRDRLILNYIITLINLFGRDSAVRILFFRIEEQYHYILKTFLVYMSIMPNVVTGLKKSIKSSDLLIDEELYERLKFV